MDPLRPYLEQLERLPFVRHVAFDGDAGVPGKAQFDGVLTVQTPHGKARFLVEHKRTHLSHDLAERLLHIRAATPNLLVLCPMVGRGLAERFRAERLNFVDLAGNCHLEIDDRYFVHVEGRRADPRRPTERGLRAQSYRVLFALLAEPGLVSATARAIAVAAGGVSPQTAVATRARFVESGLLVETARGPVWGPRGWKEGLDLFVHGYATTLAPRVAEGTYRALHSDLDALEIDLEQRLATLDGLHWGWGGGAASKRMTGYFRGEQTVLYVDAPRAGLAKNLHLRPDNTGTVHIYEAPGPAAFHSPTANCVHPLLAYVDLLAEGHERAREAAAEIYQRHLESLERAHG